MKKTRIYFYRRGIFRTDLELFVFSNESHNTQIMIFQDIEDNRRRRESAFERCSERVRIAKENGLWRTTSWGGGFQQYKGQYDRPKKEVKNKGFHVQWNTDVEAGKRGSFKKDAMELAR